MVSSHGYKARVDSINYGPTSTIATVSLRTGNFLPNELVTVANEITNVRVISSTIPSQYTTVSNYDYEFNLNESKRRIKIVDPALVEQLVKEFKDIL